METTRTPKVSMAGREPTAAERAAPLKLAQLVIRKVLQRIGEDPDLAYHLGAGSESLHLLLLADAACSGRSVIDGEDRLLEAWKGMARQPARKLLEELGRTGRRALIALKQLDEDNFYKDERREFAKALEEAGLQ